MRGLVNFDVGELVTIDGRSLKFDGLVPPLDRREDGADDLQFVDARNRRMTTLTPEEFLSAYVDGRVQFHRALEKAGDRLGDDEPSSKKIARRWRYFWTTAFDKSPVPKSTAKLSAFIDRNKHEQPDPVDPPSPHTLRRWLRERGEQDCRRPRQMGDRKHPVVGRRRVHEFVQASYDSAAQKYWSNYRVTSEDVQIEVRAAVMTENQRRAEIGMPALAVPGRTTL